MQTKQEKAARFAAGLCRNCANPHNGSAVCQYHRDKDTEYQRKRRIKQGVKVRGPNRKKGELGQIALSLSTKTTLNVLNNTTDNDLWPEQRPKTFGDCRDKTGPCPWISCKHHMLIDVDQRGTIKFNVGAVWTDEKGPGHRGEGLRVQGNLHSISTKMMRTKLNKSPLGIRAQDAHDEQVVDLLGQMQHTCILKVVDQGDRPYTLEDIGLVFSITRERVRQIQTIATRKIQQDPGTYQEVHPCA